MCIYMTMLFACYLSDHLIELSRTFSKLESTAFFKLLKYYVKIPEYITQVCNI